MSAPLLILQAGNVPARLGLADSFADMFVKRAVLAPGTYSVMDATRAAAFPKDPWEHCGYIVTGSLSMVTSRPVWSLKLTDFISKAVGRGVPVLGVCYGHHLVARALGGRVDWNPSGLEIGTHEVTLLDASDSHPFLRGLPRSFPANLSHSQSVLALPPGAEALARSGMDACQIMSYGEKVISLQFHPEFDRWTMSAFAHARFSIKDGKPVPKPRRTRKGKPSAVSLGLPIRRTPVPVLILKRFVKNALLRFDNPYSPKGFAG
ncbi:MAG: glutamine amidotransferase [Deltaproteobacteria bacterium]|jgi:GMP synthase (glutamine-hydrolysing)|nr:glutamine amidotransferase [Deltaproteobacteria bacterium]